MGKVKSRKTKRMSLRSPFRRLCKSARRGLHIVIAGSSALILMPASCFAAELTPQQSLKLRELQLKTSEVQMKVRANYIAYLQAAIEANASEVAVYNLVAELSKEAGCDIDPATAKCKPVAPVVKEPSK